MHLDEEALHRLLHAEGRGSELTRARDHLQGCGSCQERLAAAERDQLGIYNLLRQLDHPAPLITAQAIAARAGRAGRRWEAWAAGILFFIAVAGVAYALPGTGLRNWVRSIASRNAEPQPPRSTLPDPGPAPQSAGVAAVPGPAFVINFRAVEPRSQARVSLSDSKEVVVRVPSGAASFTSNAGRLIVENSDSAVTFEIEVPRSAPRVEIQVGGRQVFLKLAAAIITQAALSRDGVYSLPLEAPER
jgi:hypothetical protein